MRVSVKEVMKKSRLGQIYECTGILKYVLHILALDITERRISRNEKLCYILKAIFTAFVLGTCLFSAFQYKVKNVFHHLNVSITISDCIQTMYDYCQYVVDLILVYIYGRELSQEYFKQYETFDKSLNFSDYEAVKCKVTRVTWMILSLFFFTSALDFMGWYFSYGILIPIVYSINYVFVLIKVLANLDLASQVINIDYRLQVIGDWVQGYYECCNSKPFVKCSLEDPVTNKDWFYAGSRKRINALRSRSSKIYPAGWNTANNHSEMTWLSKCYLLLTEQCIFIDKCYGIRILMQSLSFLIDMVRYLNVAVRLAIGSQNTPFETGSFTVVTCMLKVVFSIVVMTNLVIHCEQAYRQVERIRALTDHIFINKDPDAVLRSSITELRDLVKLRPISFNMANFFRLSFSYLISMCSVVVTYTIILLQSI